MCLAVTVVGLGAGNGTGPHLGSSVGLWPSISVELEACNCSGLSPDSSMESGAYGSMWLWQVTAWSKGHVAEQSSTGVAAWSWCGSMGSGWKTFGGLHPGSSTGLEVCSGGCLCLGSRAGGPPLMAMSIRVQGPWILHQVMPSQLRVAHWPTGRQDEIVLQAEFSPLAVCLTPLT